MKTAPWLAFLVLFVHSLSAFAPMPVPLARSAPITGAAIQGWYYDSPNDAVHLRIVNIGDKPITAFSLQMTVTYDNGIPVQIGWTRDFLNTSTFLERFKGTPNESVFRAKAGPESIPVAGSYDETIAVAPNLRDFSATLTVVAYADKNAEAVSKEALESLIDMRESMVASIDKTTEVINASQTHGEAAANIQKMQKAWQAAVHEGKPDLHPGELDSIATDLDHNLPLWSPPNASESETIKNFLSVKQRERAIWADQAKLKLVGDVR